MYFYMKLTSYHRIEYTMGNVVDRIKKATDTESKRESVFIFLLIFIVVVLYIYYRTASNTPVLPSGRNTTMDKQQTALATLYAGMKGSKAAIVTSDKYRKITYKSLVNFYALACRYTGYIGPIEDGYFSVDTSVQMAVDAGCRVFVLDIDYIDKQCNSSTYLPRIVVRDSKGRMMIQYNDNYQINNPTGEIRQVCEAIQNKAFGDCQNAADPVIIVLHFLRTPPGSTKSLPVLTYYSLVAKALAPFRDRLLGNETSGGTFYRQSQESILLINPIDVYSGKVLVFCNADTSGFRNSTVPFDPYDDLDFLVNLRLTKSGNKDVASFGVMESTDYFMVLPEADKSDTIQQTKMKWTICLSPNPSLPVTKDVYDVLTQKYGVQCIPAHLFDTEASSFLFTEDLFKTYGFQGKPCNDSTNIDTCLCYIPPVTIVAGPVSPILNSNKGFLEVKPLQNNLGVKPL